MCLKHPHFEEKMAETEWATIDSISPEADIHVKGSIPKSRNGRTFTEFWLTVPRPEGISVEDWEAKQQAKWDRIFGKKEGL